MPQMVWSTLPDGFHDYYNARWYEFTGVAAGIDRRRGWNAIFHPDDQPAPGRSGGIRSRPASSMRSNTGCGDHDGVYRWTLGRATPIRNDAGEIVRWFGTCTDIDELKRTSRTEHRG
jgi:PAS domain S-box-containing protein